MQSTRKESSTHRRRLEDHKCSKKEEKRIGHTSFVPEKNINKKKILKISKNFFFFVFFANFQNIELKFLDLISKSNSKI